MALNDIWEVRIACSLGNQTSINVRHWQVTAESGTPLTPTDVANNIDSALAIPYRTILTATATYRGCGAKKIVPIPPGSEGISVSRTGFGTALGDPLPSQVSGLATLTTAMSGRAFRGRFYAAFPSESDNPVSALPDPAYVTALSNLSLVFVGNRSVIPAAGGTSLLTPILYRRSTMTGTPITGWLARAKWATQRRRGSYGRPNPLPF